MENPIVIEDRDELIFTLCEASQLEHMIMCEYLFAAFSLKREAGEGLTPEQLATVARWERAVSGVATQEMLHLALVSNLLSAIGAAPYFVRPNFPQRAKYFPPGVQLALLPYGEDALRHFLYLERPEGMELADAPAFGVLGVPASLATGREIVPVDQDFATVGHLYRGIERGFQRLADKYGERQLFVGEPNAQATKRYFAWPELIPVTDLQSAVTAIETIVEAGEGARGHWEQAHYGTFLRLWSEYEELKRQDASFEPSRPVMAASVRLPADVSGICGIEDSGTRDVADLFNGSYELLLQVLIRFFLHGGETEDELRTLSNVAVDTMVGVIKPLGQLLTTLPVGPAYPGMTAGPSFEIFRTGYLLPHRTSAWALLHERLLDLAEDCTQIATPQTWRDLTVVEAGMRTLAAALARHQDRRTP